MWPSVSFTGKDAQLYSRVSLSTRTKIFISLPGVILSAIGANTENAGGFLEGHARKCEMAMPWPSPQRTISNEFPRVLVADDDPVARVILQHTLRTWGYEVVLAQDGAEAWKVLQQEGAPKLLIVDWDMPGLNGIELCRRVRACSTEFYRYILMITSRNDKRDIVCAMEMGADDHLPKPFEDSDLRARLVVASRILAAQDKLIHAREAFRERATRDALTGLWNRAQFFELFNAELDRARRNQSALGMLLLDLDRFKSINDTFGHPTGDFVLKELARRLQRNVRSYDFAGRFGGEEFVIALPGCDRSQLRNRAEAIRRLVNREPFRVGRRDISATVSIGAAVVHQDKRSAMDILAAADLALYRAKNSGRNRTAFCERSWDEDIRASDSLQDCCALCEPRHSAVCVVSAPKPMHASAKLGHSAPRERCSAAE
jgi:diguanylate cyclase (GGDEF)-like protein